MQRKFMGLVAALAVGLTLAATSTAASAQNPQQTDYAGNCVLTVTPPNPAPGQAVVLQGTGLQPNFTTDIVLQGRGVVGTVTADANGNFTFNTTVPSNATGEIVYSITCAPSTPAVSSRVVVRQPTPVPPATGGGSTARTGFEAEPWVAAGAALVVVGFALVLGFRRRRQTPSVAA